MLLKEKQILAQAAFSGASDSESDYDSDIDIKYKLDLKDPFVKDLIAKYKHSSMKSTKKQYGDKIKYLATERLKQSARGLLKRLREAKDMLPVYEALSKQKDVVRPLKERKLILSAIEQYKAEIRTTERSLNKLMKSIKTTGKPPQK